MDNSIFEKDLIQKDGYISRNYFGSRVHYVDILYGSKHANANLDTIKLSTGNSYGDNSLKSAIIISKETLKFISLNPEYNKVLMYDGKNHTSICYVEKKSEYYKLCFDFDFKYNKYEDIFKNVNKDYKAITLHIVNIINKYILKCCNANIEYIYACKKEQAGVHIYYPNIITNKCFHSYIYKRTYDELINDEFFFKLLYGDEYELDENKQMFLEIINKIFDNCVSKGVGLRFFYHISNNDYYYPVKSLSTFKISSKKEKHFDYCFINTDATEINFKINEAYIDIINVFLTTKNEDVVIINKKEKIIKPRERVINEQELNDFIEMLDIKDMKELLVELTNLLNNVRFNYEGWIDIIYVFRNYNLKQEIIEISQNKPGYDENSLSIIEGIFNNKNMSDKPITIRTIMKYAKEDNPNEYKKIIKEYYQNQKLIIENIDDILLSNNKLKKNYVENTRYITDDAIQKINDDIDYKDNDNKFVKHIMIKAGTGNGKTTCVKKILNNYIEKRPNENISILSIVTRRSMLFCHLSAFNYKIENNEKVRDEDYNFQSYLDINVDREKHFITSLEFIRKLDCNYDVIIIDEVFSLLQYLFSQTLNEFRTKCISRLLKLIYKAKLVLYMDANISDSIIELIGEDKYFMYENNFKNKEDVEMNIYYCNTSIETNNVISYCNKFLVESVKNSKPLLILTDSKSISDTIFSYLKQFNTTTDYFLLFNKDSGTLNDMNDIAIKNDYLSNKCLISSPKIVYGLDITQKYEKNQFHLIYKKNYGYNSMGAIGMFQQISRARSCSDVNILILDLNAKSRSNKKITFEHNKKMQFYYLNKKFQEHDGLCKENKIQNALSYIQLKDGTLQFNDNDFLTRIFYYNSYYNQLFSSNKIEVVKAISRKYGYDIKEFEFVSDIKGIQEKNNIMNAKKELGDYLITMSELLLRCREKEIDEKYKQYIDCVSEITNKRYKSLEDKIKDKDDELIEKMSKTRINDVKLKKIIEERDERVFEIKVKLSSDENKYNNFINKILLDKTKEELDKINIDNNVENLLFNDIKVFKKIKFIFLMEEFLKIKRYDIEKIKIDDEEKIEKFVDFLELNKESLKIFYLDRNKSNKKTEEIINNDILKLVDINDIKNFCVVIYNYIVKDLFIIKSKQIQYNNIKKMKKSFLLNNIY
jgi:hypothetical protein